MTPYAVRTLWMATTIRVELISLACELLTSSSGERVVTCARRLFSDAPHSGFTQPLSIRRCSAG